MYSEFATDPKVQMLSESDQRRLTMLFCIRCNGDVTLQDEEVTFLLRISNDEWLVTKSIFVAKGFINSDNEILNWDKRQFISDSSAERVARHRAKKQNDVTACNVTVTPPEQNRTDTEQIQNRTDIYGAEETSAPTKKGTALPKDWVLPKSWGEWALSEKPNLSAKEVLSIAASFKDHWLANSNQARAKKSDWFAAWRNWVRNQKQSISSGPKASEPDWRREQKASIAKAVPSIAAKQNNEREVKDVYSVELG